MKFAIQSMVAALGLVGGACHATPEKAPASKPPATTRPSSLAANEPVSTPAPVAPAVDQLLDKLQHSADDLAAFTATLVYTKWDPVIGRNEIRSGNVIYQVIAPADARPAEPDAAKAPPGKRFAITFARLSIPGGRAQDIQKRYVFDSPWLVEIDDDQKQFIKRQVVPPDNPRGFDPLKLGQGPFPLPIGQAKKEVLERFDVQLIDVPARGPLARLTNVHGLRLTPKPGTREAKEYQSVDLFYDRDTLLPRGIETLAAELINEKDPESRERRTVVLRDVVRNPALAAAELQKLSVIEPTGADWRVEVDPWRGEH